MGIFKDKLRNFFKKLNNSDINEIKKSNLENETFTEKKLNNGQIKKPKVNKKPQHVKKSIAPKKSIDVKKSTDVKVLNLSRKDFDRLSKKQDIYKKIRIDISKFLKNYQRNIPKINQVNSTPSDRQDLNSRTSANREQIKANDKLPPSPQEIFLGFDLGSTCTKLVFNFAYSNLDQIAVPAISSLQADKHPYYWKTILWQSSNGEYSLLPIKDYTTITDLKLEFILNSEKTPQELVYKCKETINLTAYICLMLRQSVGWLLTAKKAQLEESIRLTFNFGYPSASLSNEHENEVFNNCCKAAISLFEDNNSINEEIIIEALKDTIEGRSSSFDYNIVPEFVASVTSYFDSTNAPQGTYLISDFGGMTIDTACFEHKIDDYGERKIIIYGSTAERFGSEISKNCLKDLTENERLDFETRHLGKNVFSKTLTNAAKKIPLHLPIWRKGVGLKTFLIGGGRHYFNCQLSLDWSELSFRQWRNTEYTPIDLLQTQNIELPLISGNRSSQRLLVASGLSSENLVKIVNTNQLQDVEMPKPKPIEHNFIGPEQM